MENTGHDIKKIRREVEAYFTLNYGEVKNRKNKGTIKRNNIPRFRFMEEVLTPFKSRNRNSKKKAF
jgi:hypothetical protein